MRAFSALPSSSVDGASLQDLELTLGGVEIGRMREPVARPVAPEPDGKVAELREGGRSEGGRNRRKIGATERQQKSGKHLRNAQHGQFQPKERCDCHKPLEKSNVFYVSPGKHETYSNIH